MSSDYTGALSDTFFMLSYLPSDLFPRMSLPEPVYAIYI